MADCIFTDATTPWEFESSVIGQRACMFSISPGRWDVCRAGGVAVRGVDGCKITESQLHCLGRVAGLRRQGSGGLLRSLVEGTGLKAASGMPHLPAVQRLPERGILLPEHPSRDPAEAHVVGQLHLG